MIHTAPRLYNCNSHAIIPAHRFTWSVFRIAWHWVFINKWCFSPSLHPVLHVRFNYTWDGCDWMSELFPSLLSVTTWPPVVDRRLSEVYGHRLSPQRRRNMARMLHKQSHNILRFALHTWYQTLFLRKRQFLLSWLLFTNCHLWYISIAFRVFTSVSVVLIGRTFTRTTIIKYVNRLNLSISSKLLFRI